MKRFASIIYFIFLICFFLISCSTISGQERIILGEMKTSEPKPSNVIPLDPSKVILVVRSKIRNLKFETNHPPVFCEKKNSGEWWLHLEAGRHIITFSDSDSEYQSLNKEIVILLEQRSKEIEITIKEPPTYKPTDVMNRPTIRHEPVANANEGDKILLIATVFDKIGISEVKLFYRTKGETKYSSKKMISIESKSNKYQSIIFAQSLNMEYYLTAKNVSGKTGLWKDDTNPQLIEISKKGNKKLLWILGGSTVTIAAIVYWFWPRPERLPAPPPAPPF